MQTTMSLLDTATAIKDLSAWADDLGLSKRVLYTAKYREHLSPAVAGALAERLGEDVERWIVIAALESEKDSACKTQMVRRLAKDSRISRNVEFKNGARFPGFACEKLPRFITCVARRAWQASPILAHIRLTSRHGWSRPSQVSGIVTRAGKAGASRRGRSMGFCSRGTR